MLRESFFHFGQEMYILFRLTSDENKGLKYTQLGAPCPAGAKCHCGYQPLARILLVFLGSDLLFMLWTRNAGLSLVIEDAGSGRAHVPWRQEKELQASSELKNL